MRTDDRAHGRGARATELAPRVIAVTLWVIVGLACALPLGWLVWQVATRPDLLGDLRPTVFRLGLLGRTIGYNLAAAILAVLLALPAAQVIGRGRGWVAVAIACATPLGLPCPPSPSRTGGFRPFG